jgi:hypothetical protein
MSLNDRKALNRAETLKLTAVVSSRDPNLLPLITALESRRLSLDEREALREVVADEFTEKGLTGDEPNQYGYMLEALIDRLGHV